MKASLVLCIALFVVAASAGLQLLSHRNYIPQGWVKGHRANPHDSHTFSIFLKQRNIKEFEKIFLSIHDPESPEWGRTLSITEILDIVAPPQETVSLVYAWLAEHGIVDSQVQNFRDSLRVQTTVGVVERLLNTELFYYSRSGRTIARQWGTAHIPESVHPLVDVFTGVDDFLPAKRQIQHRPLNSITIPDAAGYVIPQTIQNTYKIPATTTPNPNSSVALIEFQDDNSFNAQDLTYFQQQTLSPLTTVNKIVGPYSPANPDAESTLDVQYATAIAAGTTMWFWTVTGWLLDFSQAFFNTQTVPLVVSMSWGWTESAQCAITNCNGDTSQQYVARVNTEWMKIGARRVSLFAASGDQGAPGDGDPYCTGEPALNNIFPGDSPYVTSVGATMLASELDNPLTGVINHKKKPIGATPPICQVYQCATTTAEAVCTYPTALITTGGGFSTYTARPSWQSKEVSAYLTGGTPLPPPSDFNSTNRAFPDIAGLGHNYIIRLGGQWEVVDGTSCSSPVWAAITGLLNNARMNAGKAPLGFLAPNLYKLYETNPKAFIDQTTGNNKCTESCCAEVGYVAAAGWDPVTGLGTPNYPALLSYFSSLP